MKELTVARIVRAFLERESDYDGLVESGGECACGANDLAPCGDMSENCVAGHRFDYPDRDCGCGEGCDFHIRPGPRPKIGVGPGQYQIVAGSIGEARTFTITVGRVVGYAKDAVHYSAHDIHKVALDWMKGRVSEEKPYLSGTMTTSREALYAFPTEEGPRSVSEPVVEFSGEVVPLYNRNMSDTEVTELLNELAAMMGEVADQTRVYVRYRDRTWILQRAGASSPQEELT